MPPKSSLNLFGRAGEENAAKLLERKSYQIIGSNFRSKFGEIDIIAKDTVRLK